MRLFVCLLFSLYVVAAARAQTVLPDPPPIRRMSLTVFGVVPPPIHNVGAGLGLSLERWLRPHVAVGLRAAQSRFPRQPVTTYYFDVGPFARYYLTASHPRRWFAEVSGRAGHEWSRYPNTYTPAWYATFDGALGYRFALGGWAAPVFDVGIGFGSAYSRLAGRWWPEYATLRPLLHAGIAF